MVFAGFVWAYVAILLALVDVVFRQDPALAGAADRRKRFTCWLVGGLALPPIGVAVAVVYAATLMRARQRARARVLSA